MASMQNAERVELHSVLNLALVSLVRTANKHNQMKIILSLFFSHHISFTLLSVFSSCENLSDTVTPLLLLLIPLLLLLPLLFLLLHSPSPPTG